MVQINQDNAGEAAGLVDSFSQLTLFTGDTPVSTTPEVVATAAVAGADLPARSVVGRDASGNLVKAVYNANPANAIRPIGITTATVKQGSVGVSVGVYRSGMFNPDALIWDATFNTDALKRLAFEFAQPTIFLRKPEYPDASY